MAARIVAAALLLVAAAAAGGGAGPPSCEADEASCASAPPEPVRDHLLLQTRAATVVLKQGQHEAVVQPHDHWEFSGARSAATRGDPMEEHDQAGNKVPEDGASAPDALKLNGPAEKSGSVADDSVVIKDDSPVLSAPPATRTEAAGLWCQIGVPPADWALKSCPTSSSPTRTTVKVLTYNLFWWRLFGQLGGSDRSAGKLIANTAGPEEYDLMAFQECDDRWRVLQDALASGMSGEYEAIDGGYSVAIAYRKSRWTYLEGASVAVGEDGPQQYYGRRTAQWVRLLHRDGKTVFFMNHHGPLPVSSDGGCNGVATALNILNQIATHARVGDAIILVGDFNAQAHSTRIQELDKHLTRVYTGGSFGGVDHFFSNCGQQAVGRNLGGGGSDHDALSVTFTL